MGDKNQKIEIPDLPDNAAAHNIKLYSVNEYGKFLHAFDDEETVKKVVAKTLLNIIYPYAYVLGREDRKAFLESKRKRK